MTRKLFVLTPVAIALVAFFAFRSSINTLEIGDKAPMTETKLTTTADKQISLKDVAMDNGLLVMFTCNTCPVVAAWEYRYNEMAELCKKNKIGMIALNPNAAMRADRESLSEMSARAKKEAYTFPYAVDKDNQLADAFGATKTPDLFLFNGDMELVYKGAIDNSGGRGESTEDYLPNAIKNMAAGKKVDPDITKAIGCGIKRLKQ